MIRTLFTAAAVAALASTSQANLIITEVMSSSAHSAGTNNGDWFEVYNSGPAAIDLSTYSWDDNSYTAGSASFGSAVINPGQFVIFSEETVGAEAMFKANWGLASEVTVVNLGSTVFQGLSAGAAGDAVAIYDASNTLVTSVTFGLATSGVSFQWETSGASLGVSVLGVNGAFRALDDGATANTLTTDGIDIGSPGAAVPEPTSLAALGLLGLMGLRRRR